MLEYKYQDIIRRFAWRNRVPRKPYKLEKKTCSVWVRVTARQHAGLTRLAAAESRSLSNWVSARIDEAMAQRDPSTDVIL